jgi:DNA-binding PadR family transcriptional regulator
MHLAFPGRFARHHHCAGRHGGHRGFGRLGPHALGDDDAGWHGFRAGRKLSSDDLQLVILALLTEKPAHGYEIIRGLGERSGGFYTPSPGMVYPALTWLEEVGHAEVEAEGTRKLYRITSAGRAHLEAHRGTADTILAQLRWVGERMEQVREAFAGREAGTGASAHAPLFGARRHPWMTFALYQAGLELKAALFEKRGAGEAEQQRLAQVLKRAAEEVRRG